MPEDGGWAAVDSLWVREIGDVGAAFEHLTVIPGPFGRAWEMYWRRGWHPFHLPYGEKDPPPKGYTGRGAVDASFADLHA